MKLRNLFTSAVILSTFSVNLLADVVQSDDFIVQNSQCVGYDCVNGEGFGFDTLIV